MIFALALSISGCAEETSEKPISETLLSEEQVNKEVEKLVSYLGEADRSIDESMAAMLNKDFQQARDEALNAKSSVYEAQKVLEKIKTYLTDEDREFLETYIEYSNRWATLAYKTANINELSNALMDEILSEISPELALPKVKLLERGYRENADDWRELAEFLQAKKDIMARAGLGEREVGIIFDLSDATYELADTLKDYGDVLKSQIDDYTPVAERDIPGERTEEEKASPELVTREIASFFDTFDSDGNGKLSIGEAQEFFFWVENNVAYRYDNENAENPIIGFRVGDGREGGDYRQTPLETLSEKAGDCEDMATLEAAFYRYFGIEAYIVGVDAKEPGIVDHAAAIVRISEDKETFQSILGGLLYYEIGEGVKDVFGNGVTPGVYMIVDNSYSGALGYISGGTEPGTFTIHCIIPLERGYGEEWDKVVQQCVVKMD
jgi:transglutaminase-like putative cysteine protease